MSRRPSPLTAISSECNVLSLQFSGKLEALTITQAWKDARKALQDSTIKKIIVDTSQVSYCDGAGIAMLFDLRRQARERAFEIAGLKPEFAALLAQFKGEHYEDALSPVQKSSIPEEVGRASYEIWQDIKRQITFIGQLSMSLFHALRRPQNIRWQDTGLVAEKVGFDAIPIVCLIAFILGVILAFQSATPMRQFGAEIYVADMVGIALFRELGPLLTAILLAGRSGAAFAAELGTMKVNEEVNALSTMGLEPIQFLVIPRVIAATLTTPLLIIIADVIGVIGGAMVLAGLNIPFHVFFSEMFGFLSLSDFLVGVFKGGVFGFIIATIGCMRGLDTKNGASAVGQSTTSAVVTIIVLVVVLDGLFAIIFTQLGI